jgi:hypothetical protein
VATWQGNRLRGHGTEESAVAGGYKNCPMTFLNIPNIHEMRTSLDRLRDVRGCQKEAWCTQPCVVYAC